MKFSDDPSKGRLPEPDHSLPSLDVLAARARHQGEKRQEMKRRFQEGTRQAAELREAQAISAPADPQTKAPCDVPKPEPDTPKAPPVADVGEASPILPKPLDTAEASTPRVDDDRFVPGELIAPRTPLPPLYEIPFFMERPFFAIPYRGPIELRPYARDGFFIQAKALDKALGVATIDDAEILMVICTSLREAMMKDPNCREVTIKPAQTLRWLRRGNGKNQYTAFWKGLRKLCSTEITTNIGPDGRKGATVAFTFLESWEASTQRNVKIRVSDWVAKAIAMKTAIRIPDHYFDMSRGFERWLCRVVYKHAGSQRAFVINLDTLYEKSGSNDDFASFRFKIKEIVKADRMLDYIAVLVEDRQLRFSPRGSQPYMPATRPKRRMR